MMESNKEINIINEVRNKNGTLIKVNDYELCCVLGQGQFGKVYLVENINDKIRYAMKVLKRQKKAKRSARGLSANNDDDMIMNEVKIMQSLNHPHIVNLIAFINDPTMSNTNVYLIIDYVDGGSVMIIKGLNENGTPKFVCPVEGTVLGESRSCSLAAQIFDAMSYVHHHKVAHRDIKMDNILLDLNGNIRIADFGVAHTFEAISEEDLESSPKAFCKDTAGTFSFWSPEILEDKEEGYDCFAADVWAMGIVLWCFLFGELPYPALEADLLFESITVGGIPSLPTRKSPECEDILNKMLMRAPDDRITFDGLLKHAWIVDHEKPSDEGIADRPDLKAFKETSVSKKLLSWEKSASSKVIKRTSILKMQKEESIKNLKEKMQAENDDDNTENDQTTVYNTEVIINVNKVEVDMKNDQNKQQLNACCILS